MESHIASVFILGMLSIQLALTCDLPQIRGVDESTKEVLRDPTNRRRILLDMQSSGQYNQVLTCRGPDSSIDISIRKAYVSYASALACSTYSSCQKYDAGCNYPVIEGSDQPSRDYLSAYGVIESTLADMQQGGSFGQVLDCRGSNAKIVLTISPESVGQAYANNCVEYSGCGNIDDAPSTARNSNNANNPSYPGSNPGSACNDPVIRGADSFSSELLNRPGEIDRVIQMMRNSPASTNLPSVLECRGPEATVTVTMSQSQGATSSQIRMAASKGCSTQC